MKINTLKERIKNAEAKITKINGTIERHKKQLDKKSKALISKGIDLKNYDKYNRDIIDHDTYWDICDYEGKLEDIENNNNKLSQTTKKLNELKDQLEKQLAEESKNNNIIPESLNIFLENWKEKCIEYYITLANEFIKLKAKHYSKYEITKEELELLETEKYDYKNYTTRIIRVYNDEEIEKILSGGISEYEEEDIKREIRNRHIKDYVKSHFASDMKMLEKIIDIDVINESKLNKIMEQDVKVKREQFIKRIKSVIGEIKDLTDLRVSPKGEIDGIAIGVKCNARVKTITAGGYNIQCYHFRVLVNTIK